MAEGNLFVMNIHSINFKRKQPFEMKSAEETLFPERLGELGSKLFLDTQFMFVFLTLKSMNSKMFLLWNTYSVLLRSFEILGLLKLPSNLQCGWVRMSSCPICEQI